MTGQANVDTLSRTSVKIIKKRVTQSVGTRTVEDNDERKKKIKPLA